MYFPIFRGKQYELLALRNCIEKISVSNIVIPIVEPVKMIFRDLYSYLQAYNQRNLPNILIINPVVGELSRNRRLIDELIVKVKENYPSTEFAYRINDGTSTEEVSTFLTTIGTSKFHFIHESAYVNPIELIESSNTQNFGAHIFIATGSSRAYQAQFSAFRRVLIQDNFSQPQRNNADYANTPDEFFTDQHLTYQSDRLYGFGDYSIVGDKFSEHGGQAHTAAIHFAYEKESQNNEVWIRHFISETYDVDPNAATMIVEAATELSSFLEENPSILTYSNAASEFQSIAREGSRTNLGKVKEISMRHHIELMIDILTSA